MINDFNFKANKLTEDFCKEKDFCENNGERLREVISELVERVKGEINEEKKEREDNEDTLLTILENTCMKIESVTE